MTIKIIKLEMKRDAQPHMGPVPDLNWVYYDADGGEHRWQQVDGRWVLPSLKQETHQDLTTEGLVEWPTFHDPVNGDQVEPGFKVGAIWLYGPVRFEGEFEASELPPTDFMLESVEKNFEGSGRCLVRQVIIRRGTTSRFETEPQAPIFGWFQVMGPCTIDGENYE